MRKVALTLHISHFEKKKKLLLFGQCTHSLKTVDKTTVWTILEFTHHILQANKVSDIDDRLIFKAGWCSSRVEIHKMACSFRILEMGHERPSECGLACTGRPRH